MAPLKRVSPEEAKALLDEGWIYLDVRSEQEFEAGHPTGAINIPLLRMSGGGMTPNPHFLKVVQGVLPLEARIVVGCQSGGRSLQAARIISEAGYSNIVDQRAGFGGARDGSGQIVEPGWSARKLPVESGKPENRSYAALLKSALK